MDKWLKKTVFSPVSLQPVDQTSIPLLFAAPAPGAVGAPGPGGTSPSVFDQRAGLAEIPPPLYPIAPGCFALSSALSSFCISEVYPPSNQISFRDPKRVQSSVTCRHGSFLSALTMFVPSLSW